MPNDLVVFAASGVELRSSALQRAKRRLNSLGFEVRLDESVRHRHQRFAGTDEQRLATLHRLAQQAPSIALACRGGYGLTRLLDRIDWAAVARSIDAGTRWVGYSDWTAFELALWAHTGRSSWHGPMATEDFGAEDVGDPKTAGLREVTQQSFVEAMSGQLEGIGFRTESGFDGLSARGRLWGGNLSMVVSLLGTPHWPKRLTGGILFLEDVGEHPYRIERMLLQLVQAGVIGRQRAVLLGDFGGWRPSPHDRRYSFKAMVDCVRSATDTPILTGLPIGHGALKLPIAQGVRTDLMVQGRDVLLMPHD